MHSGASFNLPIAIYALSAPFMSLFLFHEKCLQYLLKYPTHSVYYIGKTSHCQVQPQAQKTLSHRKKPAAGKSFICAKTFLITHPMMTVQKVCPKKLVVPWRRGIFQKSVASCFSG